MDFLKKSKITLLVTALFLGFFAVNAQAQFLGVGDSLDITMTPERPKDHEIVTISLQNYSTDLNRAVITWIVDGEIVRKGAGEKNLTFTTGSLGKATEVNIIIQTIQGPVLNKTIYIRPADVSLVWEADSYTPPFYRGKALYTYQGVVRIVAVPEFIDLEGKKLSADTLVYTWKEKGQVAGDASGYGRRIFSIKGGIPFRPTIISVEVSTVDKQMIAESSIELEPGGPEVILYGEAPLEGILFNKALNGKSSFIGSELGIVAIPYFFSATTPTARDLVYKWNMNGFTLESFTGNNLTLKQGNVDGQSSIGVEVRSEANMFQFASNETSVVLGKEQVNF